MYQQILNEAYQSILTDKDKEILNTFIEYFNVCLQENDSAVFNTVDVQYSELVTDDVSLGEVKHAFRNINLPYSIDKANITGIVFNEEMMTLSLEGVFEPASPEDIEKREDEYNKLIHADIIEELTAAGLTDANIKQIFNKAMYPPTAENTDVDKSSDGRVVMVYYESPGGTWKMYFIDQKFVLFILEEDIDEDPKTEVYDTPMMWRLLHILDGVLFNS